MAGLLQPGLQIGGGVEDRGVDRVRRFRLSWLQQLGGNRAAEIPLPRQLT
ncbi:hypothetical protein GOZ90_24215 [Agrobacterium vitis]|uniref:Uncharacterized protein n=1 Tax=Agrobacterium vitis TaxID=373 RepID=A0A6L6VLZ3_AGRVI|nr:hypothetical protein [Agrobacterium vitis]